MRSTMRFAVIVSPKKAEIHEHDISSLKSNEILIKNKTCNLCTTDYQQWMGLRKHQPVPVAFGHENSGTIVEIGKDVSNFEKGEMVVVNIYQPCLQCSNCRKGMNSIFCLNKAAGAKDKYGYYGFYGCGEYQIFNSKYVFKVNKNLPFEHAGFTEPLATVLYGTKKLRIETGDKILIIGAGTMGLLNAQVARYYGGDVIISEISEKKLNTAKKLGFEKLININNEDLAGKIENFTKGKGLNVIIITVGNTRANNQALDVASKGCRLLIFASGYPTPAWKLDSNLVHYKLLEIIGTFGCSTADYQLSTELLNDKKIDVSPLIEERYLLKNVQEAFVKAASPDTYRVVVCIQD